MIVFRNIPINLKKWFIDDNGWRHYAGFLAFGYIILFVGNTDLARTTKEFPLSFLWSFYQQNLILKLVALAIPTLILSYDIEARQKNKFNIPISVPDIVFGCLGVWSAILLEVKCHNIFLLVFFSLVFSACVGYLILQLNNKLK